jgi:hypothetical protein
MALYFDLPTTGQLAFSRCLVDPSGSSQTSRAALLATNARQRLRLALKTCKRTDWPARDWLGVLNVLLCLDVACLS